MAFANMHLRREGMGVIGMRLEQLLEGARGVAIFPEKKLTLALEKNHRRRLGMFRVSLQIIRAQRQPAGKATAPESGLGAEAQNHFPLTVFRVLGHQPFKHRGGFGILLTAEQVFGQFEKQLVHQGVAAKLFHRRCQNRRRGRVFFLPLEHPAVPQSDCRIRAPFLGQNGEY